MDTALVTGADSGIGLQIARQLIELGYRVYGLAADFGGCSWQHHDFQQITCDLSRTEHLQKAWEHIAQHDPQVDVVVHAYRAPAFPEGFEAAAGQDIAHVVQSGLLAPLLLTRWALPSLIRFRGYVINIGWNGEGNCPQGAAAAAIEGGLYHWTQSLFEELRDTGVKVCTVYPQRNSGTADPKARLKLEPQSEVDAKFVARAVAQLLQLRENNLITQLVVRPQGTREEPRIAPSVEPLLGGPKDIVLPDPDKRPPPPTPIPTPERRRPDDAWEFDDEDEDDEFEEDDELDAMLESSRRMLREQNDNARRQLQRSREQDHKRQNERGEKRPDKRSDERGEKRREQPRRQDAAESRHGGSESRENRRNDGRSEQHSAKVETDIARTTPSDRDGAPAASHAAPAAPHAVPAEFHTASAETASDAQRQQPRGDTRAAESAANADGEDGKRRRRRRRGGRGRNRNRGEGGAEFEGGSREANRPASAQNEPASPAARPARPEHPERPEQQRAKEHHRFDRQPDRQPAAADRTEQRQAPASATSQGKPVAEQAAQRDLRKTAAPRRGKPSAPVAEKPVESVREKSVQPVREKPVSERQAAPVAEKSLRPPAEKSSTATADKPVAIAFAKSTAVASGKSAAEKTVKPAAAKPVQPVGTKPAQSVEAKPVRTATEKPTASVGRKAVDSKAEATDKGVAKKAATKKAAVKKTAVKKVATKKAAVRKTAAKKAAGSATKKSDGAASA